MSSQNNKVLFILPHYNFRDKEYTWIVERLRDAGIPYEVASDHLSEAEGMFGEIVKPDVLLGFVSSADYQAFVFVGEEAADSFIGNPDVTRIIQNACSSHKIVGAIGHAVKLLSLNNVVSRRKIAGPVLLHREIEGAGAFYSAHIAEHDGNIITCNGPYSTREFATFLISSLRIDSAFENNYGRRYLR